VGKGGKILLGCGIAVVVVGMGVAVLVIGGAYWAKGKAETYVSGIAAKTEEITRYEKQANQNPFTPPADGALQEPQLVKFLDVRKQIYAVYQQHKSDFDSLAERTKNKKDLSISETLEAGTLMARLAGDVRLVQMKALAADGMSETEYRYIQQAVYKSAWAREFEKDGALQPGDHVRAMASAGAGVPGGKEVFDDLANRAKALDVPQTNLELYRKYEEDIKKYAMTGLVAFGL
jgi:hypothetical protein